MLYESEQFIKQEVCTSEICPMIMSYGQDLDDFSLAIAKAIELMLGNNPDNIKKGAILRIRHVGTGRVVALMNLTHLLAQGRTAYELQNYPHQEYLDREYDYHLDFLLKGDAWAYCDIRINVLSWSKRIENIEL